MTSCHFNREMDEVLIRMVQCHPCLYNVRDRYYKDKMKRYETWLEIGSAMNVDGNMCQCRWKNIRDRYMKLKNRTTRRPASASSIQAAEVCKPVWPLFKLMNFLDDTTSCEAISSSMPLCVVETAFDSSPIEDSPAMSPSLEEVFDERKERTTITRRKRTRLGKEVEKPRQEFGPDEMFLLSLMPMYKEIDPRKKILFNIEVQKLLYKYRFENDT